VFEAIEKSTERPAEDLMAIESTGKSKERTWQLKPLF
jgi:hypothetical protein